MRMKTGDLRREREIRRRAGYRETILHAAEEVILRKGFSSTTMDDIAREAQFSKATLYKYVPSKGMLLYEIMVHYFEEIRNGLAGILAEPASAGEKLRRSIRMILEYNKDKESITRVLWMDNSMLKFMRVFATSSGKTGPASSLDRKMLAGFRQKRLELVEVGAKIIEEGIGAGEFRRMDARAALSFVEVVLQGYTHNRFWQGDASVTVDVADDLTRFILEGIRNPERPVKEK
jgi:AcrR family transcriptional regulator